MADNRARRPLTKAPPREPDAPAPPEAPAAPPSRFSPEEVAKRAVALRPTTPSGHRVKYTVTLYLPRDVAEYITARAIREKRNVPALIGEMLGREAKARAS
jgi:hypothetical protein